MLLCARFRRTCFNWLFICLIASTVLVYALLNALTYTSKPQQSQDTQDERVLPSDRQYAIVITDSSRNTQRPVSIASLRLLRKFRFEETTESFDNSNSENATDVDGNEDIGMEKKGTVIIRGNVEENVRREVRRLHLRPPKRVRYSYGQWQIVDSGRQVYIYSAFYDNRPDIDWPQVRIIAVAESDVHLYGLCCLLWYRSQPLPDVAEISVVQVGPKISPRGQSLLEQFIFTCRLDTNKTDTPTSVSLVGPHSFRLSNLLPVHVPERPKHVIDVGHCISILYWKHDPFRLVEWLEANRMWGVGEINIYATAIDSVTDSILKRYSDTGFVKYRQSPGPLGDGYRDAIRLSMSPVINDCMYRNLYRYRYVMSTDIDEMIVPASPHHNYAEMLTAAAAAATRSNAVVHSFVFRNVYFFLDFGATEKEPWYLVTQRSCIMFFIV